MKARLILLMTLVCAGAVGPQDDKWFVDFTKKVGLDKARPMRIVKSG